MGSVIGKTPISGIPWTPAGDLNPLPDGSYTLTINNSTGEVLSVQPDGSWQTRPKGTAGPYERAFLDGGLLTYCPDGIHIYRFSYGRCPNV